MAAPSHEIIIICLASVDVFFHNRESLSTARFLTERGKKWQSSNSAEAPFFSSGADRHFPL